MNYRSHLQNLVLQSFQNEKLSQLFHSTCLHNECSSNKSVRKDILQEYELCSAF